VTGPTLRDRSARRPSPAGRRRASERAPSFQSSFIALGTLAYEGASVSIAVVDLASGDSVFAIDERIVLPVASIGKILLLIEISARISDGSLSDLTIIDRAEGDAVADSGIWQHLRAPSLPVADLAALVGSASDNVATNVLLRQVGLESVRARAESLGLARTALLDSVRGDRGPDDAPHLSVGSTAELAGLFRDLEHGSVVSAATSQRVLGWLELNADLSMVASAFGRDPLAHRGAEHNTSMVNKTGTDRGVRAEAGILRGPRGGVAYAISVRFDEHDLATRLRVLDALRVFGLDLMEFVH
jgi:beta-lactamase class A